MQYKFSRLKHICIYGAGEVGTNAVSALRQNGYDVICYLDKKREGIEPTNNLPIIKLYSEEERNLSRDCLVVIALADGIAHLGVANNLHEIGFRYIVMLPMELSISKRHKLLYTMFYNDCLKGSIDNKLIKEYEELIKPSIDCDGVIEREDTDHQELIVWVKVHQVYSEHLSLWRGDKSKVTRVWENMDVNCTAYIAYLQLWEYLEGKIEDCPMHWASFLPQLDEEGKKRELKKRERLYRTYEIEWATGFESFAESAPYAIWNKNRWNLHGGHHRVAYLIYKGLREIPIRISRKDYEKWCNMDVFPEVRDYIWKNHIYQLKSPISHPAFRFFNAKREINQKSILDAVFRQLRMENFVPDSALDISDLDGYFVRAIARKGSGESFYISDRKENLHFTKLINKLVYLDKIHCDSTIPWKCLVEVGFAIALNICNIEKAIEVVDHLLPHIRKYLYIELLEDVDVGDLCMKFQIARHECIHREIIDAKRYCTWLFDVEGMNDGD